MSTETTNKKIKIDNGTTFGRTYTDKAIDAKLPTDLIASANKLSLGAGNTALGNGVNLDGFTYDEATKTLKAEGSGATLPTGTETDPFKVNDINIYGKSPALTFKNAIKLQLDTPNNSSPSASIKNASKNSSVTLNINGKSNRYITYNMRYPSSADSNTLYIPLYPEVSGKTSILYVNGITPSIKVIPTDKTESYYLNGTYDATNGTSAIKWSVLKKTYNHYIVISNGTASNAIYLLIPSTNSLICSSLPELNTLLGTAQRFIQASGVVTDTASKLPIVALNWQGSFSSSKIVTMSSEEATTKFTNVVDVVTPL